MHTKLNLAHLIKLGTGLGLCAALCAAAHPAFASADGLPRLDPTNGNQGTAYTFTMNGSTRSMDPALQGGTLAWAGGLLLFQDVGSANFQAEMDLDTNKDGIPDRTLDCSGMIGTGRFSMRCTQNDGNGELRFLLTGRALSLDNGKLAMRRAGGRGYTGTHTFLFTFQGTEAP